MRLALATVGWILLFFAGVHMAPAATIDYLRDIKPILAAHCYACHGALEQKGGLRLDTAALLHQGGDSGPAIVPHQAEKSLLVDHLLGRHGMRRMPPRGVGEALKPVEIARLQAWIDEGARSPAGEKPEPDPREHWAFRPPARPALPVVRQTAWSRNPIDAFIAAEQEKHGLTPGRPAERRLLLRRVYLDLIGLPPTRQDLDAFGADPAPDAYEKVVDRLLASPRYAERWGRHWMDIWRYSDPWGLGAEMRNSQKHIWHWRDWILASLSADKGYDAMVREMLAADELYPNDLDRLRATGFLVRPYFKFNRNTWLEDTVEHTSKAFLGLTINCARCHDHKFDPISQLDYYRFRAFFEPYQVRTDELPGQPDLQKDGLPRVFDCNLDAPTYLFVRGDEKHPKKNHRLRPGVPVLLGGAPLDIRPVRLPLDAHDPELRPFVLEDQLHLAAGRLAAARRAQVQAKIKHDTAALHAADKAVAVAVPEEEALRVRAAADQARAKKSSQARTLAHLAVLTERHLAVARAEADLARVELTAAQANNKAQAAKQVTNARQALMVAKAHCRDAGENYTPLQGSLKTPESNVESATSLHRPFPTISSGRRTALARWLTDRHNPLTARVAVNHMWARHFGRPLVATVFDFGRRGSPPTHPALLDWLAVEFMDHGWSMKHLHRLMVTSNTYRLASASVGADVNRTRDPENRYYWRMNPVRMEAEVVRDSVLHLSGELNPAMGGPPLDPVGQALSTRRSLYFVHSHNDEHRFLSLFDEANVLECYRRAESIVPQQALALSNSTLALHAADRIAARLEAKLGAAAPGQFVQVSFETILASSPTVAEQAACEHALARLTTLLQRQHVPNAVHRARADLIHALINHNDFITIR